MVEILNAKGLTVTTSSDGDDDHPALYGTNPTVSVRPEAFGRYMKRHAESLEEFLTRCELADFMVRFYGAGEKGVRAQPTFVFFIPAKNEWLSVPGRTEAEYTGFRRKRMKMFEADVERYL